MNPQQKVFLRAEWKNLLIANYVCDQQILKKYLPAKTELDTFRGEHLVSLVAFQFLKTRVLGIQFPFHTNFVEVNLRFYVKYKESGEWKRGVVFVKEIVPRHIITFIANTFFNENYITLPTEYTIENTHPTLKLQYRWGDGNYFNAEANSEASEINNNSLEEFITEHYWGFARINDYKTMQYGVEHPKWKMFPLLQYRLQCNFAALYGENFSYLSHTEPHSVLLAQGSNILVRKGFQISGKTTSLL